MAEQQTTKNSAAAVFVSNISPEANEKTVSDFFSFCGKIDELYLSKGEAGQVSSAVVRFETESAARTALLLSNALIVDRPITVVAYGQTAEESKIQNPENAVPKDKITQRNFDVPDEQRSKTSAIASLAAAGYVGLQDAVDKARKFDEEHSLSVKAKQALEQVKTKLDQVDQQYHISEKTMAVKDAVVAKGKQLDETYKISEKATAAATSVKETATALAAKAQENATVQKGVTAVTASFQTVKNTLNDYKDQTVRAIEEKQQQRKSSAQASSGGDGPAEAEAAATEAAKVDPVD